MRTLTATSKTSRILLVIGCHGNAVDAWQRPYLGEVAHYKAGALVMFDELVLRWSQPKLACSVKMPQEPSAASLCVS